VKCFDMKKLLKSSQATLLMILAGIAIISGSSYSIDEAMAFPHASLVIDPEEEHANNITIVLGHTNEPAYGKLPGIHDGKHNLEVDISDTATTLPIREANITADKYYFKSLKNFQNAQSLEDADDIELNVPVTAVFGQPGTFYNRQVVDPGIYGYTINGTINYYDVAFVPFEATKFCSIPGEDLTNSSIPGADLTKFDTPDNWTGSYGCVQNIKSIYFPESQKRPDYPPKDNYDYGYNNDKGNYGYENGYSTNYEDKEGYENGYSTNYEDKEGYENGYSNNNSYVNPRDY
jgi:hypothetical protein